MDDAINASFASVGIPFENRYHAQTILQLYNNTCAFETKIMYNKVLYTFYHSISDGTVVYSKQESWLAGDFLDIMEIVKDYFANTYGANRDEVSVPSGSGAINDSIKNATAVYNGETYYFEIVQKTGVIQSVVKK